MKGSNGLKKNGIENPRMNAERLLSAVLNFNRSDLYLNSDLALNSTELFRFQKKLQRRLRHEPLQYILGETEFMSLPFQVDRDVLIPRPETELLVERVIEKCQRQFDLNQKFKILDIGTGSGCIAVSLAKYLKEVQVVALDVSKSALLVAAKNAEANDVSDRIEFRKCDIMQDIISNKCAEKFDVIVANPPYISTADYENLPNEIKDFEPSIALQADSDGLIFFRKIAHLASGILKQSGFIAMEIGAGQARHAREIFSKYNFSEIQVFKDLNFIERVLIAE